MISLVAIALAGLALVGVAHFGTQPGWELARRQICASRLNAIGKAYTFYAGDNDEHMPWMPSNDWTVATGTNARQVAQPDKVSVTALFFLLIRNEQDPGLFVCPSDRQASRMTDPKFQEGGQKHYYWDFFDDRKGAVAADHAKLCSYSIQAPLLWGDDYQPGFTTRSPGALVIVSDKTPQCDGKNPTTDWTAKLTKEQARAGMSQNHSAGNFINVLHADSHVGDGKRADLGINKDNIFSASGQEKAGTQGAGTVNLKDHKCRDDSFLLGPVK